MSKIDKEFCLTDNSVNCYGYRLLTEGFLLNRFNPPIGYLMHERNKGVAVRWEDFQVKANKLYAKPVVNTILFPDLPAQIISGFYSGASVGHIVALETTENNKQEGQTGVTVTKWFCRECSIVDIPGNYNALAKIFNVNDKLMFDLSANTETSLYVPEKYTGKTYNDLWVDGELSTIKEYYP